MTEDALFLLALVAFLGWRAGALAVRELRRAAVATSRRPRTSQSASIESSVSPRVPLMNRAICDRAMPASRESSESDRPESSIASRS